MATTTQKKAATADKGAWVPNATFAERPTALGHSPMMDAYIQYCMEARTTVHFKADHGIGKTSKVLEYFENKGILVNYINLANITPDDKLAVAPVTSADGQLALKQLLMEDLTPGVPFAIVLDDAAQASRQVQNQFMQLTNNWSIGQQVLKDLVAVVMLDNEGAAEGIRASEDMAVADRKVTIRLSPNDTGWRYALARKYKSTALNGVFDVWDSLNTDLRHVLSPRALDHVLYCTLNGFPPIFGLPIMGDHRVRLQTPAGDRTKEILERIATSVGQPYRETIPDAVRKAIQHALRDRLAIVIQGPPGVGKTEITKELIAQANLREVYYSMPFTDPEALVAPMPTKAGTLKALIAQELLDPDPYAIVWDEYNRPSSQASFAKLMEVTQQWTLAGIELPGCRAQIALCNPSEWMGRRMQVAKGNIAQADRFTISIQITADDIPANEWLLTQWPDTVSNGDPERRERARSVIEAVLEWFKVDIGDEHRQWITKRTLVRLATLHMAGLPLEAGKIYLGEGEYAPVPLLDLEARLADRPMTRLNEIAADVDTWTQRLKEAQETSAVGTNDVDMVHQALSLAELSQLWENFDAVTKLVGLLPPKLKITFFVGASAETQALWIAVLEVVGGNKKLSDIVRP